MRSSAIFTAILLAVISVSASPPDPGDPFAGSLPVKPRGKIDELVLGRLKRLGIQPSGVCSDSVFVRRVFLDAIGTLPTEEEARSFLQDRSSDKRRTLIDRLLAREEFADYWAMKWCDLLRVKSEFPINLWPNAVQAYHRWIRSSVRDNLPYDRFVRELLTGSGSNFRAPQVNFYRATQSREPQAIAQAVALTFMGSRADRWQKDRLTGTAAFFSQIGYKSTQEWKEEIVYFDPAKREGGAGGTGPRTAVFPDGKSVRLPPDRDPREVFADWLVTPKNPWFARNFANRAWYWLLGRGVINEPDDIRPDNPPSNPELLACLERELVSARFDVKHLFRLILNSTTYQLSSVPSSSRPEAAAAFAFYPVRRLEAEVLIDALCQITGTTEQYSSAIPEPFTFIPENQRSIGLADGSITSPFLETFGRPPRDTGLEAERSNRPTASQRLHMLNSSHVQRKIEQGPRLQAIMQRRGTPREAVTALYLTVLSRFPTETELAAIGSHTRVSGGNRRAAAVDLVWALVNGAEFSYRH